MDIDEKQAQVEEDIARARQAYEKMLETAKPLQAITPVNIDIVPLTAEAILIENDEQKNRQE